jgi:hypothetical protein
MDIYTYVASCNPYQAKSIIHKFGYSVRDVNDAKDLGICLKKVVAFEGEPALHDVLDSHPDKLILLEKFSSKKDEEHKSHDGSKCGCSSVEKHYMNFNGNAESQTNKSTRDISYFILASALLLASAIIVKK